MPKPREVLDRILRDISGSDPVYFQPPENLKMSYPCIRYERDRSYDIFADNGKYVLRKGYMITRISKDPDDPKLDQIEALPLCSYVRHYVADNLNHDVYLIYS